MLKLFGERAEGHQTQFFSVIPLEKIPYALLCHPHKTDVQIKCVPNHRKNWNQNVGSF